MNEDTLNCVALLVMEKDLTWDILCEYIMTIVCSKILKNKVICYKQTDRQTDKLPGIPTNTQYGSQCIHYLLKKGGGAFLVFRDTLILIYYPLHYYTNQMQAMESASD